MTTRVGTPVVGAVLVAVHGVLTLVSPQHDHRSTSYCPWCAPSTLCAASLIALSLIATQAGGVWRSEASCTDGQVCGLQVVSVEEIDVLIRFS